LQRGLEPGERAARALDWFDSLWKQRFGLLAARHPEASEGELLALWFEETYRGRADTPPDVLERACALIRKRGRLPRPGA
jgi:hypothetical protein